MVGVEAALEIRVLHRHGKSTREIARETGVARNTVRRYLRDEAAARYKPRPPRSTKLDPFKVVASLQPQQVVEPVIRFETGPGEQMQVDWAALAPCMMRGPGCAAGESGPSGGGGMSALISWCPKPTTSPAPI
jgi:transposase